jgi:hypothetical protein
VIRPLIATLALTLVPAVAIAQTVPSPSPSAAPVPSPAPAASPAGSTLYTALRPNDPCTSLSAIITRPSVTNSVCTVRPNHVLVETGYTNTTTPGVGSTVNYPLTLIRVGTKIPGLEFDLTPPSAIRTSGAGGVLTGTSDVGAGLKYVLGYTPKFNYGAQVFFTAPTGTNAFSANGTNANYALQAGYTINSVLSLSGAAQLFEFANNGARFSSFVPSLLLNASLPWSSGVFVEAARFSNANGRGTPARMQYMLGVTHDVGQRLQLDVEAGISPTISTGKSHFVGFGAAYYF